MTGWLHHPLVASKSWIQHTPHTDEWLFRVGWIRRMSTQHKTEIWSPSSLEAASGCWTKTTFGWKRHRATCSGQEHKAKEWTTCKQNDGESSFESLMSYTNRMVVAVACTLGTYKDVWCTDMYRYVQYVCKYPLIGAHIHMVPISMRQAGSMLHTQMSNKTTKNAVHLRCSFLRAHPAPDWSRQRQFGHVPSTLLGIDSDHFTNRKMSSFFIRQLKDLKGSIESAIFEKKVLNELLYSQPELCHRSPVECHACRWQAPKALITVWNTESWMNRNDMEWCRCKLDVCMLSLLDKQQSSCHNKRASSRRILTKKHIQRTHFTLVRTSSEGWTPTAIQYCRLLKPSVSQLLPLTWRQPKKSGHITEMELEENPQQHTKSYVIHNTCRKSKADWTLP